MKRTIKVFMFLALAFFLIFLVFTKNGANAENASIVPYVMKLYSSTSEQLNATVLQSIENQNTKKTLVKEPEPKIEIKHKYKISDEDVRLIALVTMAEAESEPEKGKRLVIDTILNRVDHKRFPNTVRGVIYQKNQFTSLWNGRVKRCVVREDIRRLVLEELESRTNYDCIFFQMYKYSTYGTPLFKVGNHYFSNYK